jgi:predicted NBD/HSP70 family sugar kinase
MAHTALGAEALRLREERVLGALRVSGASSRRQLSQRLGISRTAMSAVTSTLLQRGAIVVVDTDSQTRSGSGRPAELLALDPSAGHFIGIDFRHRDARVVVADASHEILARGAVTYDESVAWDERIDAVDAEIRRLMGRERFHLGVLQCIGVGVPGPVLLGMLSAKEWPTVQPQLIVDRFTKTYGVPVLLDNNVRLAALGEASAMGSECQNLLFLRIGIGVGGAVILDRRLAVGHRRLAAELGHVRVAGSDDPCRCRRRGCLETVASVPAILRACADAGIEVDSAADLAPYADDERLVRVLTPVVEALVSVLGPAAMTTDPHEIVLAGDVFRAVPWLVDRIRVRLADCDFPGAEVRAVVRDDVLGDDGGAIGALHAVFRTAQPHVDYTPSNPHMKEVAAS